jgi:hypothetical protein
MKTQLKIKDIPQLLGLSQNGVSHLMNQMGWEYCLWWCGQPHKADAEMLYINQDFQDWWVSQWITQDEGFLGSLSKLNLYNSQHNHQVMMSRYMAFHRPQNETIESNGDLILYKTILPQEVQKSFSRDKWKMERSIKNLIKSISSN